MLSCFRYLPNQNHDLAIFRSGTSASNRLPQAWEENSEQFSKFVTSDADSV